MPEQAAFLGHDALHAARLARVDQDGEDGLDEAFHIDVFQELVVLHFADLYVVRRDAQAARPQRQGDDVDEQAQEGGPAQQVVTVADVPRFLFQLYVHILLVNDNLSASFGADYADSTDNLFTVND